MAINSTSTDESPSNGVTVNGAGTNGVGHSAGAGVDYASIVIGAGFGGIRMLHELRKLGLSAKVIEAGSDVGGTWYWNRYPGARTDTESWQYIVNFSKELNADWVWKERFPTQPEVLKYLGNVADRFDMRKDIQFDTRVKSAHYEESRNIWTLTTEQGESWTCTYLITATGPLSAPRKPPFEGIDSFQGEWYQTPTWPKDQVDFTGKRVAVIGTGATGVQVIPIVAHSAKTVTVFQRTPNYVLPARNHPLTEAHAAEIKRNYPEIWDRARNQVFGFDFASYNRTVDDVKDEAHHQQILENGWESGGFRFVFETFDDILVNEKSNAAAAEFVRRKIRSIVKDEKTAELLCPNYPIQAKRPPLGHFYYEAFNRPNVKLVDVSKDAIQEITPEGLRTGTAEYEFDIIIYAIGFDAVTGALNQIDIRGKNNRSLSEEWAKRLESFLGIAVEGYPNMLMISGPQAPFANIPILIDNTVDWIGLLLSHMKEHGYTRAETTQEAEDGWCEQVLAVYNATLLSKASVQVNAWFVGANIPGKPLNVLFYFGGLPRYFKHCKVESDAGFPHIKFSSPSAS